MEVRVRMYRQGLGDCFLLTFGSGDEGRHALIDCGTLGATTTGVAMKQVAEDIEAATDGRLELLIATHEHKDHVSGFRDQREVFDRIEVGNVWLAWTEDAEDELARELVKHQGDLVEAVRLGAVALLRNDAPVAAERDALAALGGGMREVLSFVGDPGGDADALLGASDLAKTVQEAMAWVTRKAPVRFLRPGGEAIEPPWLPGVRFYVLGPPRDPAAIAQLGEHGSPELYHLAAARARDVRAGAPFLASGRSMAEFLDGRDPGERQELELLLPFDLRHRLDATDPAVRERFPAYFAAGEEWRRIDHDWLAGTAELALQLDNATNNTSLALAIELIDDGAVLLFPGDAQVGNWLSWHRDEMKWTVHEPDGGERTVTAADLLARTVLYKVGHHASHNATVTEKGLEMMASAELVALVPVDRRVAMNKHPPWQMPARALYVRLLAKAQGRVVRSDTGWVARDDEQLAGRFSAAQWDAWEQRQGAAGVVVEERFVEWRRG